MVGAERGVARAAGGDGHVDATVRRQHGQGQRGHARRGGQRLVDEAAATGRPVRVAGAVAVGCRAVLVAVARGDRHHRQRRNGEAGQRSRRRTWRHATETATGGGGP